MPKFNYVALDARGQESVGALEAATSNDVIAHLRQSGYFPTSVTEEGKQSAKAAKKKTPKAVAAKAPAKKASAPTAKPAAEKKPAAKKAPAPKKAKE